MHDPQDDFIEIDLPHRQVKYKLGNSFTTHFSEEEYVRIYYVTKLLGTSRFKKQDIFVEQEYEFQIGRGNKKTRIDIVVHRQNKPLILMEVKSPTEFDSGKYRFIRGQLFGVANNLPDTERLNWLVYATIETNDQIEEDVVTIDYTKFDTYKKWKASNEPSFSQIPSSTSRFTEKLIKKQTILKPLTKPSILKLKRRLHNTLWRGGTRADNKVFFNLLKMIVSKVYDENETHDNSPYVFQLKYAGNVIDYEATASVVQELYQKTLQSKNYLDFSQNRLRQVSKVEKGIESIELTDEEIAYVVTEFQNYSLSITDYDALGLFFETILRERFKQTVGCYFTHQNLVLFLVLATSLDELAKRLLVQEERLPYIIDPCAGSGTFLIESMKVVTRAVVENRSTIGVNDTIRGMIETDFDKGMKRHPWAKEYVYGIDRNPHLLLTTKVNMIMHGDGHIHVYPDDALNEFDQFEALLSHQKDSSVYNGKVNEQFDVVFSNPPFSMDIDEKSKDQYRDTFPALGSGKDSEILFLERWYQLLKPKGRLGVVLPESIFDTTNNLDVRVFLYKYFWVKAVISLPEGMKKGAFAPYTGTKTSLLLCQKKDPEETKQWNVLWTENLHRFLNLKKELQGYFGKKTERRSRTMPQYESDKREDFLKKVKEYLDQSFSDYDSTLSIGQTVAKYADDFWSVERDAWVFKRVANEMSKIYPEAKTKILVIHTDYIGYKRTTRREDITENHLFRRNANGEVALDHSHAQTEAILDLLRRELVWD